MHIHVPEFHDSPAVSANLRRFVTDAIAFIAAVFSPYRRVLPKLAEAVKKNGACDIVDLCSGAAAPAVQFSRFLKKQGHPHRLVLTDKYPNIPAFERAAAGDDGSIAFIREPVDALHLPQPLKGFRLVFAAFHHFRPAEARKILTDAVGAGEGIAVLEYTAPSPQVWPFLLCLPLFLWVVTPFIRPRRLSRLLLTYVLPVIPFAVMWDAAASCLNTYSPAELERMVADLRPGYDWDIGRVYQFGFWPVTYLIGAPRGK